MSTEIGDNVKGLVLYHHGRLKKATAAKDSAVGALRNAAKQAKADEVDVDPVI